MMTQAGRSLSSTVLRFWKPVLYGRKGWLSTYYSGSGFGPAHFTSLFV